MNEEVGYRTVTLENVDRGIRDWFDKSVDARVQSPNEELRKVPVFFSSGERWSVGRTRQLFRDENGILILPVISVRRVSIEPDVTKMALGCQTENIQVAVRVDPKSNDLQNLLTRGANNPASGTLQTNLNSPNRSFPPVYDVYTVPFPDLMQATYQLVIQTQFISQMNEILQKMWRMLDIQKSFVALLENDGRLSPKTYQFDSPYYKVPKLPASYVVGFLDSTSNDSGNIEEFTDTERIIKYSTEVRVPFALQTAPEGAPSPLKVTRTAYKVVMNTEVTHWSDNPADIDAIFSK